MKPILLDTHAALWSADGTLASKPARAITAAAEISQLLLSPITAWEIGYLATKGRILLTMSVTEYVNRLFRSPGLITAALTPSIAAAAAALPSTVPRDPADRFIVATAIAYGADLMTRDQAILRYAKTSKALHCIAC